MTVTTTDRSGLVGQSVRRVEDIRLLHGQGRYVADHEPPGTLHAAFLRSPLAHARITSIDATRARRAPGVVAVFTGTDMEALTHPFVPLVTMPNLYTPLFHCLSAEKVRHVGDPIAIVVAESRHLAEDALESIDVEFEPLDSIASMGDALRSAAPQIWERADGNVLYERDWTFGDVDAVFASADRVVTERFVSHRQTNQPMETRGIVVGPGDDGRLTVRVATQAPQLVRWAIAALASKRSVRNSVRDFVGNTERRTSFVAAAKQFLSDAKDDLKKADNAAMKSQVSKDMNHLKVMAQAGLALLGAEDYPHVEVDDVGGGFGSKGPVAREELAVAAAAIELGCTVKWIEDRVENLMDGGQAREEALTLSIAVDRDGTFRGLRFHLDLDQGAYPGFPFGGALTAGIMKVMSPGSYRWDAYQMSTRCIATNKGKVVPYRGPWANETWARERLVDIVARGLGLRPEEVRLKNMIGDDVPADTMVSGPPVDETLATKGTLRRALELLDLPAFCADQERARAEGRYLGVGIASYHEAAPGPPAYPDFIEPGNAALASEEGWAAVLPDGSVEMYTSQMPHGQSHETTYGQIIADELGVPIDQVRLVFGDTDKSPFSVIGTGGSRGGPIGGGVAKYSSRQLREQVVEHAATMLEADVADIDIVDGNIHVAGVPSKGVTYAEVAESAIAERGTVDVRGGEAAFGAHQSYGGKGDGGWSVATHACIVEVDLETGQVTFPRYLVVEDCGPIINPAIVDGQVRGGVAQGIGAVLYEKVAYDEDANLNSATYIDYLIPTAMEIPEIEIHHLESHSPGGENDFRGVGEGGMIGAPAAITNAIEDALAPFGARITEQHLPPTRILELAGVIERE
ncbi:MAG: xanthine dehydrogenase family protein molybdopterin-binding subunit [Ilumatobacter sp.]|uniref:xanthine dehydrogenase family protein molybdopterin-binding subunit n=1 Tax=Ilumatobacter sp. TaxID=1967498 RepID=UPI0026034B12|nr:xanthine dehydrogenase family protein molybdopterin-binding subunit [Ilumatobacter sp.]MDJ0769624.1 xanthine dehydrogenase family protein molybdopterin-binding subunit [Ilumatobacter sp.]